jgi:hypothetical protein
MYWVIDLVWGGTHSKWATSWTDSLWLAHHAHKIHPLDKDEILGRVVLDPGGEALEDVVE